jgi:hypothetical protein
LCACIDGLVSWAREREGLAVAKPGGVLPESTLKRLGVFPWRAFVLEESIFPKSRRERLLLDPNVISALRRNAR